MNTWGLDLRCYRNQTMNYLKNIRDFGFVKKYDTICLAMPYVTAIRPQQIQTQLLLSIIEYTYDTYKTFAKRGLWKSKHQQNHLQQFTLLLLHNLHTSDPKLKKKHSQFDKFLLNFFYTLNLLKTCNKYIKCYANFLNSNYSFGELFLYLCLKNISVMRNDQEMVCSGVLKKVIRVFQAEEGMGMGSGNVSVSVSRDGGEDEERMIGINTIFVEPIQGCLSFPKVKMFKIMKICKMVDDSEQDGIEWGQFLKKYFQMVQQGGQICFQHIVSATIAKHTYQLSKTLLPTSPPQTHQNFLQQSFSYIFQILQAVFSQSQPQIPDKTTKQNIQALRKHFEYMKKLNQHDIHVVNKFCKKILKNWYVLELFRKYL